MRRIVGIVAPEGHIHYSEWAKRNKLSPAMVYNWIHTRKLPVVFIGQHGYVPADAKPLTPARQVTAPEGYQTVDEFCRERDVSQHLVRGWMSTGKLAFKMWCGRLFPEAGAELPFFRKTKRSIGTAASVVALMLFSLPAFAAEDTQVYTFTNGQLTRIQLDDLAKKIEAKKSEKTEDAGWIARLHDKGKRWADHHPKTWAVTRFGSKVFLFTLQCGSQVGNIIRY